MSLAISSYRDLLVWQKAMQLVDCIYTLTESFPRSQQYRLVDQMQRAAVSIPSNIAEGTKRATRKDYRQFLVIAQSSGAELETQLEISRRRKYGDQCALSTAQCLLDEVMRMLHRIVEKLTL